jgi:arylsulfatase A-like enzyme
MIFNGVYRTLQQGALLLIASLLFVVSQASAQSARHPNIVLILADDLGYGDLRCYNDQSKVDTPCLDRLAKEGLRLLDAHSPATVCTPSRLSLLTGQMAFRVPRGSKVFTGLGGPSLIAKDQWTIPKMLRQQGYSNWAVGKWHLGLTFYDTLGKPIHDDTPQAVERADFSRRIDGGPLDHGFDRFFGTACCPTTDWLYAFIQDDRIVNPPSKRIDKTKLPEHPYSHDCRNGWIAPDFPMEQVDLVFLNQSQQFLEEHVRSEPDKPFFLYHATQAVHLPSFPADKFQGKTQAGPHGDFIHELDWIVGQLMETLDRLGVADNTIVIFSSDNGPETTSVVHMRADYEHDPARPWRGMKRDQWEAGHRVPLIVRWPGKIQPSSTSNQLTSLTDIMATLAHVVGAQLPSGSAQDSFNMLPVWLSQDRQAIRPYMLTQAFGGERTLSIRKDHWKYIDHPGSGGNRYENNPELKRFILPESAPSAPGQLYNLELDPGETTNLYLKHPDMVTELKDLLKGLVEQGRTRDAVR